uniref:Uncharacterized protein n=1 Tax=Arundo donax TaxID=35708 RepID=A0A0A9DUS0_ARUDO
MYTAASPVTMQAHASPICIELGELNIKLILFFNVFPNIQSIYSVQIRSALCVNLTANICCPVLHFLCIYWRLWSQLPLVLQPQQLQVHRGVLLIHGLASSQYFNEVTARYTPAPTGYVKPTL